MYRGFHRVCILVEGPNLSTTSCPDMLNHLLTTDKNAKRTRDTEEQGGQVKTELGVGLVIGTGEGPHLRRRRSRRMRSSRRGSSLLLFGPGGLILGDRSL